MSRVILPLIGSQHAPEHNMPLRVEGIWHRAINLFTGTGELLTLHDAGRGITPGGWVLRHHDFIAVREALWRNARIAANEDSIHIGGLTLLPPKKRCSLRLSMLPAKIELPASLVEQTEETGLFGPLRQVLALPISPALKQLCHCYRAALRGDIPDWRPWLGLGPGLTPSSDDMLVGMLLASRFEGGLSEGQCANFFTASGCLSAVTTRVSVSYLRYASQGLFSSPLLHFVASLRPGRGHSLATEKLLGFGHTSGADTLLGFWLAHQTIHKDER